MSTHTPGHSLRAGGISPAEIEYVTTRTIGRMSDGTAKAAVLAQFWLLRTFSDLADNRRH